MDENFNLMESNISTLIENVNNSNINNDIEIVKVNIGKTNTAKDVKVLKISSVSKYLRTNIPEKDIYKDSKDLRGNKRINRIELYPDLDNDIFVPIYYPIKNKEVRDEYRINKNGEIINIKTKQLLLGAITKRNYCQVVLINKNK